MANDEALSRDRMRDILHVKINDPWGAWAQVDEDNLIISPCRDDFFLNKINTISQQKSA